MSEWKSTENNLLPYSTWCLLWLVTNDPQNSGPVIGQTSIFNRGEFWDGYCFRPMEWISHWMPLPAAPPLPWNRRPLFSAKIESNNESSKNKVDEGK